MWNVIVEPAAETDLDNLWASGDAEKRAAVSLIEVSLEEVAHDDGFLDRMYRRHETLVATATIDADRLVAFWNDRTEPRNLSRLKLWHVPEEGGRLCPYRIVYAVDARSDSYHILGIVHRNTDYDRNHPLIARILRDYDDLGIP